MLAANEGMLNTKEREVFKVDGNEGERCLAQTKGVLEHKEGECSIPTRGGCSI